jgi:hypothetical protein
MSFSKNSGNLLIATGVLHNIIGFVMGWNVLADIVKSGFVNSIHEEMDRNAIFWFLFGGFAMIMLGKLMQDYIKAGSSLPKWLGVSLLVLSLTGAIMMPVSGFWLVIPQALLVLSMQKKRQESFV